MPAREARGPFVYRCLNTSMTRGARVQAIVRAIIPNRWAVRGATLIGITGIIGTGMKRASEDNGSGTAPSVGRTKSF